MEALHHIIVQYGYFGIFGLSSCWESSDFPFLTKLFSAFCGYLANQGELTPPFTILAAFLGSCRGITVSYLIGRIPGLALLSDLGSTFTSPRSALTGSISGSKKWGNGCS